MVSGLCNRRKVIFWAEKKHPIGDLIRRPRLLTCY